MQRHWQRHWRSRAGLKKSCDPHSIPAVHRGITWIKLGTLIKAEDPSPFPALTQIEVYGKEGGDNIEGH